MNKIIKKIPGFSDKTILYSVWFLVFVVPLAFFKDIQLEAAKLGLVYFVAVIILFSWLMKALIQKRLTLRWNLFTLVIILFLLSLILTLPFSNDLNTSFFGQYKRFHGGFLSYLAYSAVFFVVVNNFGIHQAKKTAVVGIISALLVSLFGLVHYFSLDAPRAYATLQQPGFYASHIAIFFFISTGLMLESKNWLLKVLFLFSSTILYLGFTFSYTRGTTLGLIGAILLLTFILVYARKSTKKVLEKYLRPNFKFLITLTSFILLANVFFGNALINRPIITQELELAGVDTTLTESGNNRLIVWKGTINSIKQSPIFGFGLETFNTNFLKYRPVEMNNTSEWYKYFDRAHNEYLQFFATTGFLGGASYLLLVASSGLFTFKLIRKKKYNFLSLAIIASFVSYYVHLFFLFSVVTTATMFFLLLALLVIISKEYTEVSIDLRFLNAKRFKFLFASVIALFFLSGIYYASIFTLSEIYVARSISAFRELDLSRSYNFMKKANSVNKLQPIYDVELAKNASVYAALTKDEDQREELIREVDSLNSQALNPQSNNIFLLISAREAYFNLNRYLPGNQKYLNKAIQIQEDIVERSPTSALEFYYLARLQYRAQDPQSAEISAKKALNLKSDYIDSKILLARIYKEQGKTKKFKEIADELGDDLPTDLKIKEQQKN